MRARACVVAVSCLFACSGNVTPDEPAPLPGLPPCDGTTADPSPQPIAQATNAAHLSASPWGLVWTEQDTIRLLPAGEPTPRILASNTTVRFIFADSDALYWMDHNGQVWHLTGPEAQQHCVAQVEEAGSFAGNSTRLFTSVPLGEMSARILSIDRANGALQEVLVTGWRIPALAADESDLYWIEHKDDRARLQKKSLDGTAADQLLWESHTTHAGCTLSLSASFVSWMQIAPQDVTPLFRSPRKATGTQVLASLRGVFHQVSDDRAVFLLGYGTDALPGAVEQDAPLHLYRIDAAGLSIVDDTNNISSVVLTQDAVVWATPTTIMRACRP